jgi:hypothetical protein
MTQRETTRVTEGENRGSWYIDALDGLGGYAFASFRKAGEDSWESPIVAVSPPTFIAEPIASGATAFAATRGSFQQGFVLDGEEVPFAECAHLSEFVRRLFTAASGGENDGGAAEPQAPVAPSEGSGGDGESLWALRKALYEFDDLSKGIELHAKPFTWPSIDQSHPSDYAASLEAAAVLIYKTISSVPTVALSQVDSLVRLSWASAALGFSEPWPLFRHMDFSPAWWPLSQPGVIDDVLADLPIPQDIGLALKLPMKSWTLFHLLSFGCAAPRAFNQVHPDALKLFLFAASLIVANAESRRYQRGVLQWLWSRLPGPPPGVADEGFRRLYAATIDWLSMSLPRFVFGTQIEDIIQNAPQLRYDNNPEGTSTASAANA